MNRQIKHKKASTLGVNALCLFRITDYSKLNTGFD